MTVQGIGRTAFNILTVIFAGIGALSLLAGLAFGALILWADHEDNKPIKWPVPTRECQVVNGHQLSDAQLLDSAIALWESDTENEGEAYRRKHVGGPVLRDESVVERLNAAPDDGTVYTNQELDFGGDLRMRLRLANEGVRQYAKVTVALKPPFNPDLTVQRKTASHVYDFDLCGAQLY